MSLCASISRTLLVLVGVLLLALPRTLPACDEPKVDGLQEIEGQVRSIHERAREALVKVHARRELTGGELDLIPVHRIGTGFFINDKGRVLTAASVVQDADTCQIEWQSREHPARVIGRCARTNLALLEMDSVTETPGLVLGDSQMLRVGSILLAIGFPSGMPSTLLMAMVNGIEIRAGNHVFATSHIRADCNLRPGMAGSPLLNTRGEVVAMAVLAHSMDGCYALPALAIKRVCDDLVEFGEPRYCWAGLDVTARTHSQLGADSPLHSSLVVRAVMDDTPAAAAGFRAGDRLMRIDNRDVRGLADVLDPMFLHHSGDRIPFTVLRGRKEIDLSLVVGSRPHAASSPRPRRLSQPMIVPVSDNR